MAESLLELSNATYHSLLLRVRETKSADYRHSGLTSLPPWTGEGKLTPLSYPQCPSGLSFCCFFSTSQPLSCQAGIPALCAWNSSVIALDLSHLMDHGLIKVRGTSSELVSLFLVHHTLEAGCLACSNFLLPFNSFHLSHELLSQHRDASCTVVQTLSCVL